MGGDEDRGGQRVLGQARECVAGGLDGLGEASWLDVFGLHAGRAVQQQDGLDGLLTDLLRERSCDGEGDQGQGDELQQQKEVPLEPLEGLVGGEVSDQVIPQEGRRDLLVVPPHLQEIEDDDDRQAYAERQGQRRKEVHRTTPRRRKTSKTRLSIGVDVSMGT